MPPMSNHHASRVIYGKKTIALAFMLLFCALIEQFLQTTRVTTVFLSHI